MVDANYRSIKLASGVVMKQAANVLLWGELSLLMFLIVMKQQIVDSHRWINVRKIKCVVRSSL